MIRGDDMKKGQSIYIRPLTADDAEACLKLQTDNRAFFEQFSMERAPDFYTLEAQKSGCKLFMTTCRKTKIITLVSFTGMMMR